MRHACCDVGRHGTRALGGPRRARSRPPARHPPRHHAPLQPVVRLLPRVRQDERAGSDRNPSPEDRPPRASEVRVRHAHRWRVAAPSGCGRARRVRPRARDDGVPQHERLSAHARLDRGAERRRPVCDAAVGRQRHAERRLEEVAQDAAAQAPPAAGARAVSRAHQLRARQLAARGGARGRAHGDRARLRPVDVAHARGRWFDGGARSARARCLRRDPAHGAARARVPLGRSVHAAAARRRRDAVEVPRRRPDVPRRRIRARPPVRAAHGTPGKPLALYTEDDIRHYFDAPKPCAATCPVAYAHHASRLDAVRAQDGAPISVGPLVQIRRARPLLDDRACDSATAS